MVSEFLCSDLMNSIIKMGNHWFKPHPSHKLTVWHWANYYACIHTPCPLQSRDHEADLPYGTVNTTVESISAKQHADSKTLCSTK